MASAGAGLPQASAGDVATAIGAPKGEMITSCQVPQIATQPCSALQPTRLWPMPGDQHHQRSVRSRGTGAYATAGAPRSPLGTRPRSLEVKAIQLAGRIGTVTGKLT